MTRLVLAAFFAYAALSACSHTAIEAHRHEPPSFSQISDRPAPPPTARQSLYAAVFGFIALGIGLLLAGMMLWSALC